MPTPRLLQLSLLVTLFALPAVGQNLSCEKFVLPNGMTVILHEDHSLPRVVVNTWFRVGSKDETAGRSGFAHLFEHLMFMGTERAPGNTFDTLMEGGGGSNNASTTEDRTNYYSEGPAAMLPTLLWLDADRFEDVGRTMTKEKLDRQRDIVRNEIRQNVENTPYGRAEEAVFRVLFPVGHPYHEAVYGTHADLEAATVDDVKDFFATYYVPNNASLVVAGDFDSKQVRPLVTQLFGTLPRGGEVTRKIVGAASLDHVVRTTMLDRVQQPLVKMVWHSPRAHSDGDADLVLLGSLLANGKSSRLYKRLVIDDHIATDVSAYQDSLSLGSLFSIDVTVAPGVDLGTIERTVDEELVRLQRDGITAAELEQRKATLELRSITRLQSLGAVADALNQYEFVYGEPNSFARDNQRYRDTTVDSVRRVAEAVLQLDRRAILRVLPEQPERAGSPRDQAPTAGTGGAFVPPAPETFALQNGLRVQLWQKHELPLVSLRVLFRSGHALVEPRRAGLVALMTQMLQEGAGDLDALAFADRMQSLGASFGVWADHETVTASLTVLRRNLDQAAHLLGDALRRPRFEASDWQRVHRLHLEELNQSDDNPNLVAGRVGMRELYGADDPYGWPVDGTVATVAPLTLDLMRQQHRQLISPDHAVVLIAGDVTVAAAREMLEREFADWTATGETPAAAPASTPSSAEALRVVLVDRPEAVQTVVRLFMPGPVYRSPERVGCQMLNAVLGGGFTSRLNQNLREDHGYAYGANSNFWMTPTHGYMMAQSNVRTDVTGAAVQELMAEVHRLIGGVQGDLTDAEVSKARATLLDATIQSYAGLGGVLANAATLVGNGMPLSTIADDLSAMQQTTTAQLNGICRGVLPLNRGVLVLVGDRQAILPQLQKLSLPTPLERDVHGDPLPR